MRSNWMKLAISVAAIVAMQVFSVAARADALTGKLVDLSSVDSTVTVQLEGAPVEKRFVTYKVAEGARWHICLEDSCVIKKGVDGFKTVNEYAEFGAYGIPRRTYDVTLNVKDKVATELEVQIVPKVH